MQRLCFIHTVPGLIDRFAGLMARDLPEISVSHMLDQSLLQDLLAHGPSTSITARVVRQAMLARDAKAALIVFTCSSTSPAVDVARQMIDVPILKIDDPMAAAAVQAGRRLGVLCTTESTREPSQALLASHAKAAGREVDIDVVHVRGAFDALSTGERDLHDRLVRQAASALAGRCDVIVLAQASLAHLQSEIEAAVSHPVFASPEWLMGTLRARFGEAGA